MSDKDRKLHIAQMVSATNQMAEYEGRIAELEAALTQARVAVEAWADTLVLHSDAKNQPEWLRCIKRDKKADLARIDAVLKGEKG